MIKSFDRGNLPTVRADIEAALAQVAQKHGIKLGIGNIQFTPDGSSFTSKLSASVKSETGRPVMPKHEKQLLSALFNIEEEEVDTIQMIDKKSGRVFHFAGYNARSYSKPIKLIDTQGGEAKAPESWVKFHLAQRPVKTQ